LPRNRIKIAQELLSIQTNKQQQQQNSFDTNSAHKYKYTQNNKNENNELQQQAWNAVKVEAWKAVSGHVNCLRRRRAVDTPSSPFGHPPQLPSSHGRVKIKKKPQASRRDKRDLIL